MAESCAPALLAQEYPMTTSAEFREYARECLRWAAEATDEAARQSLLETAKFWTHAALRLDGAQFMELDAPGGSADARSRDGARDADSG
jgi:hypothetical protein